MYGCTVFGSVLGQQVKDGEGGENEADDAVECEEGGLKARPASAGEDDVLRDEQRCYDGDGKGVEHA